MLGSGGLTVMSGSTWLGCPALVALILGVKRVHAMNHPLEKKWQNALNQIRTWALINSP
jgi:hypothetical protein